jgi:hypothetical protein
MPCTRCEYFSIGDNMRFLWWLALLCSSHLFAMNKPFRDARRAPKIQSLSFNELMHADYLQRVVTAYHQQHMLDPHINTTEIESLRKPNESNQAWYARLQFFASFLKKQDELIQLMKDQVETQHIYNASMELYDSLYADIGSVIQDGSERIHSFQCAPSLEVESASLALNRADQEGKSPAEKIAFVEKLAHSATDRLLLAILLCEKNGYLCDIRAEKRNCTLSCLNQISPDDLLRHLSEVRGYCYPFCQTMAIENIFSVTAK